MDWIPAITTTSLLAFAMYLAKSMIITRLKNSIKHEFDAELEELRSTLKTKEQQIDSLRSGAMSGLIARQSVLYQRKINAIDQLWSTVKEIEKGKSICATIATLNYEECVKESARNPKFRETFKIMSGIFDMKKLDLSGANKARPFITPLAWAYYSAYSSIILLAVTKMEMLKIGIEDSEKFFAKDSSSNLLKTVLPSRAEYIDKNGTSAHYYLLEEVENLLLFELKNIQDGSETDKENTKRAEEITKEVEKVKNEVSEIQKNT